MNYSIREIANSRSPDKKRTDAMDVWVHYVIRPLSYPVTWLALRLNLSANQVSVASMLLALAGCLLLLTADFRIGLVGVILLNLWIVLDCVDGNIARVKRSASPTGEFFDALSGYFFTALLYVFLSVNAFLNGSQIGWPILVIGGLTSMLTIFPRLIEHKAANVFADIDRTTTNKMSYGPAQIVALNVAGMAGLANPLFLIAFLLHRLDLYILAYFVIHLAIAVYSIRTVFARIAKRAHPAA